MNARRSALLIMLATLAGFALRLVLLDAHPLREDEAIYSMWARAAWDDPWFLHTWPDKPPLFLWLQAGALRLWGASDAGARLLSIFAGTTTIPLAAATAQRVWRGVAWQRGAAVAAAWLLALNPFAIAFAPTAYTDTLLLFWAMLALALGLRGRWLGAGAALGAAIMTKQQGLLFVPLMAALPLVYMQAGARLRVWALLVLGAALVLLPILAWDAARWASAPSPWDLGVRNYGALRLAPPELWLNRARSWAILLRYMGGNWAGWLALVVLTLGGVVALRRTAPHPRPLSMRRTAPHPPAPSPCGEGEVSADAVLPLSAWRGGRGVRCCSAHEYTSTQSTAFPWLLGAWALGFLLLHVVSTVQVWDRYLLPLAPVLAILVGGWAAAASGKWRPSARMIASLILLVLLTLPAVTAARGGFPIGADHGDYDGLNEALAWVVAQGPEKQLLYHNVLGWNARYTLYDGVQAAQVELRWFASSAALADNAAKSAWLPRTLILPDWAPVPYLASALAQRGLLLVQEMRSGKMTVYSIVEGTHAVAECAWCFSRVRSDAPWPLALPFDPNRATPTQ